MNREVEQALQTVLQNWNSMAQADYEDSEAAADTFESSFYKFIDTVREWATGLEPHLRHWRNSWGFLWYKISLNSFQPRSI
ncbi:hypothetical protein LJK88_25505 [Paenibacillus sp. P26]|nr:hypothetical protein LJK88_25505 [Paenibacillus sp. P26]